MMDTTGRATIRQGVRNMLVLAGQDPDSPDLQDTPHRVLAAFLEMTSGYDEPVADLFKTFDDHSDEMVVLSGIRFASLCEHHLLPFVGTATVGYIPRDRVVGVSKLARVVDAYARRLQVQERLTRQVADAIELHLEPVGVGVVMQAHHACMGVRGACQPDALMTTSAMHGALRDKPEARAEFLALARLQR